MIPRSTAVLLRPFCIAASLLLLTAPARTQDLLPIEAKALRQKAAGDYAGAATTLLELARATAANGTAADRTASARVEAWCTQALTLQRGRPTLELLQRFDALQQTPFVENDPLLRDRIGLCAFTLAELSPAGAADERAQALGFLREFWLVGPFANERGSGYRRTLPPEAELDLSAELPGKQRPVRWRQLPPVSQHHALSLGRIVDPHEQSLVYAAVALVAEGATTAVLELGTTGSFRVFCNRIEVAAREVERPFAYDQDSIVLPLEAGSNLLLLKLCHQEGNEFFAAARLRAIDGSPLRTVRASVARADLLAGNARTPAAASTPAIVADTGGRSHWQIGTPKGADALRLAWLWQARAADGDKDRRDRAAAVAAAVELPEAAEAHLLVAEASERHARSAADRDENERRRSLERALALDGNHTAVLVQLGTLLRTTSNLWREARDLADRALQVRPGLTGALLLRRATLRDERLGELADAELIAAAAAPDAAPAVLREAAQVLDDREAAAALLLRQRVLRESESESDLCAAATLLARTGKATEAAQLLQRALDRSPYAVQALRQLANLHIAHDEPAKALELLENWLTIAPDDASSMVLASTCWRHRRDEVAEAVTYQQDLLREALAVEPTRRDEERYVEFLAATAETGDSNPFYGAFQVDATTTLQADAGPPADSAAAKDPLHWILRQQVVRANGNGTKNVYLHLIARVLTEDGARSLAFYRLPYWNGEQRARLLSCTVHRKDGSVQHPALQGARVRLPDLRPGDVVAIEGRTDDLQPSFFGDYFGQVHSFAAPDGSPVRTNELVVLADPGREYRCQAVNGAPAPERSTLPDGTLLFRWRMQDIPRDIPELRRPDRKEYEPIVRMTTYRDWDHFASWWWNLVKNQVEVTPPMRATIARLTDGLTSTEAKIAAIYEFVTTEVRYEAWEFGVHGYKPYSTAIIHERRHGDCKDKALLMCAMLGEIGVPCKPVIIFADPLRSHDDLELAMVEHFNHCIAWLPPADGRKGQFLDGTATWHPTDTLPDMDQGARVLIVDDGRADLRMVPEATPTTNVEQNEFTVTLQPDGSATLQVAYQPLGNQATGLRQMLGTEPARRREVVERNLVQTFGKLALGELTASDPLDLDAPVHLRATAELTEIGQRSALQWQLPSTWNPANLQAMANEPERHTPLLLGVPNGAVHTVRYRLPAGWRTTTLPAAVQRTTPFGTFSLLWRSDGSEVTVERTLRLTAPRIDAADYAAFRDFAVAVKAADDQLVLLTKEGGR